MKSSNDPITNQTSDLPACSAVPLILTILKQLSVAFQLDYLSEPVPYWLSLSLATFTNSSLTSRYGKIIKHTGLCIK